MSVMLCTGATFARIVSFDTAGHLILSLFYSRIRPKILRLLLVTLFHSNDVIIVPPIKSYLNQYFQVSQLLKYDANIVIT